MAVTAATLRIERDAAHAEVAELREQIGGLRVAAALAYAVCFDCLPPVDCTHGDAPADEDGGV